MTHKIKAKLNAFFIQLFESFSFLFFKLKKAFKYIKIKQNQIQVLT